MLALTADRASFARLQPPPPAPASSPAAPPHPLLYFPLVNVYSVPLPAVPVGAPAFEQSSSYVAFDEANAYVAMTNGQIAALSLATGALKWTIEAVVAGGLATGDALLFVAGDGDLEGRAAADGAVKWRRPIGGQITAPLVWDAGWLIAATDQQEVLALRADDGTIVWRVKTNATMQARPALAGERLYVPFSDGRVVAYLLNDGTAVWEHTLGDAASDVLALEDRVFVGSRDNYFYCLDPHTGRRKWAVRTGADVIGTPTVDRSQVFFVSLDNVLRSLDRSNGHIKWQQPLPLRPPSGPIIVDDMLIVSGVSVKIRGFLTRQGKPVGDYGAPADLAAPPHYALHVPGAPAAPLLILLLIDDSGTARLEALTSELPII